MQIPDDATIPDAKLTRYLLVPKARNDKSKFLAKAGFTLNNPDDLKRALRSLANANPATEDDRNEYGTFYRVTGQLVGFDGVVLSVVTIWLQRQVDN
ncbi:MAG: DUF6883 domain-containing protein [Cyanobacteria bacterium P01_C01_bin.147]